MSGGPRGSASLPPQQTVSLKLLPQWAQLNYVLLQWEVTELGLFSGCSLVSMGEWGKGPCSGPWLDPVLTPS